MRINLEFPFFFFHKFLVSFQTQVVVKQNFQKGSTAKRETRQFIQKRHWRVNRRMMNADALRCYGYVRRMYVRYPHQLWCVLTRSYYFKLFTDNVARYSPKFAIEIRRKSSLGI